MVARNVTGQFDELTKACVGYVPLRMMVSKSRTPRPMLIVLYSRRTNTVVSITRPPVQDMAESKTHLVWQRGSANDVQLTESPGSVSGDDDGTAGRLTRFPLPAGYNLALG